MRLLRSISLIFFLCGFLCACGQWLSPAEGRALLRAKEFWRNEGVACAVADDCRFHVQDSDGKLRVTLQQGAGVDRWSYVLSIDKATDQIIPEETFSVGF